MTNFRHSRPFRRAVAALTLSVTTAVLAACSGAARPSTEAGGGNGIVLEPQAKPTTTVAGAKRTTTTAAGEATSTTVSNETKVGADEATAAPFAFTSLSLDGASVDGKALYSDAPLMMVFVTPWCPVCLQEGPLFAASAAEHPDVTYAFVHASGTVDEYKQYLDGAGIEGTNVVNIDDTDGSLWRRFGVANQPSFVLVDKQGLMRASTGALDEAGLAKATAMIETGIV